MLYKNRMLELRNTRQITQKDMAENILLGRSLYSQYEEEYVIMPIKHLNSFCNYFNVSLDYLFSFIQEEQYQNTKHEIDKIESGKRLKEFRKEIKLTQNKLATILNTTQTVIAGYESGRYIIATPFLFTICKKYKISADYLLGKIDTPKQLK